MSMKLMVDLHSGHSASHTVRDVWYPRVADPVVMLSFLTEETESQGPTVSRDSKKHVFLSIPIMLAM